MADLFDLQDEIAQAIASALHVKLSGTPAPFMQYKPSLPAYEALLKARHYRGLLRPDLFPRAKECFEQAIALDPKFALAHCEYGDLFRDDGCPGSCCRPTRLVDGALPGAEGPGAGSFPPRRTRDAGRRGGCLEYDWKEAERQLPPGDCSRSRSGQCTLCTPWLPSPENWPVGQKPFSRWSWDCKKIR